MSPGLPPVIAIDGPSASGKGTVAYCVARRLGFHYLDSGALYRTVALAAMEAGIDLDDESRVSAIALNANIGFKNERVWLGSRDVTEAIREEKVSEGASRVAALRGVRAALLERQHAFRMAPGLVAEGRDMATIVFPDAVLKVYLTAGAEERARRRYKQLIDKGLSANMTALLQDIHARDARDSGRAVAPLQRSGDAIEIDTTGMTVEEASAQIVSCYGQALRAP
ncbi:MAG: (d)CMP kinase [Betaproteobacteria bacterium]|nr:(d)CMP kinase [Betaproteobacteria bacterium]